MVSRKSLVCQGFYWTVARRRVYCSSTLAAAPGRLLLQHFVDCLIDCSIHYSYYRPGVYHTPSTHTQATTQRRQPALNQHETTTSLSHPYFSTTQSNSRSKHHRHGYGGRKDSVSTQLYHLPASTHAPAQSILETSLTNNLVVFRELLTKPRNELTYVTSSCQQC